MFLFLAISSCSRLPNLQGKGEVFMQGVWLQDSVEIQKLQTYTLHQFKFSCDSFYVDFTTHSKVDFYGPECFNNGIWKEHAKGTYQVRQDTLILVGNFTKEDYKQKVSGCYRNGRYIANFKLVTNTKDNIVFESVNDQVDISLQLKEQINCVQKAL